MGSSKGEKQKLAKRKQERDKVYCLCVKTLVGFNCWIYCVNSREFHKIYSFSLCQYLLSASRITIVFFFFFNSPFLAIFSPYPFLFLSLIHIYTHDSSFSSSSILQTNSLFLNTVTNTHPRACAHRIRIFLFPSTSCLSY